MTAGVPARRESPLLGFLLRDILSLMRADFARRAAGLGLTPALHRLLFHLDREPGCRQVELASVMDITPVTVGRMLDRLEKQRLVRRAAHPEDRRATCVYLDEHGVELMKRLQRIALATEDRALRGIGAPERAALRAALRNVRDNLASNVPPRRRRRRGS